MGTFRAVGARRSIVAVSLAAVLLTAAPATASEGRAAAADRLRRLEASLVRWTNAVRERHHVPALRVDVSVSRYAESHSRRMGRRGALFHSGSSAVTDALSGTGWARYGENIGMGPSLRTVERAFLRSAGHRDNVLQRAYRYVGVGVVRAGGSVWVTSVFYG